MGRCSGGQHLCGVVFDLLMIVVGWCVCGKRAAHMDKQTNMLLEHELMNVLYFDRKIPTEYMQNVTKTAAGDVHGSDHWMLICLFYSHNFIIINK